MSWIRLAGNFFLPEQGYGRADDGLESECWMVRRKDGGHYGGSQRNRGDLCRLGYRKASPSDDCDAGKEILRFLRDCFLEEAGGQKKPDGIVGAKPATCKVKSIRILAPKKR